MAGAGVSLRDALLNQYQAILAAGTAGFALLSGSWLPFLVLAGLELLLLPTIVGNGRLANALAMRRGGALAPGTGLSVAPPPRLTAEGLSFERRQRFAEIQSLAAVIERSYARLSEVSQPLLLEQRAKLDQLLGNALAHLKALDAFEDLGAAKASPETLAPEIAELERRIADPATPDTLRQRLRDGRDYKVRLAESMARGKERREVLVAELETLETALKILAQESAALLAPGEVSARLDELVAGAEAAGETVREIEELSRQGEAAQRQRATLLQ
jgi:hypothetical protein